MEKYPKLFVKAGIIYLAVGVLVGLVLSFNPPLGINPIFVHVHLNLLGFMAFVIFGIGYHILPRFNAKPVSFPLLIPLHFYLANIGLIGLVSSYLLSSPIFFKLFAVISTGSVLLFVVNIFPVLGDTVAVGEGSDSSSSISAVKKSQLISAEDKLGVVLDASPSLVPLMEELGFKDVSNPAFRAGFAKFVTLKQACAQNNIPLELFMKKINEAAEGEGYQPPEEASPASSHSVEQSPPDERKAVVTSPTLSYGELCRGDVFIGDLLNIYPETKKVIEKHYGSGCFSCPGQANETIMQSTLMHGIELDMILDEINSEIKKNSLSSPAT